MGVSNQTLSFFNQCVPSGSLSGKIMIELGNQNFGKGTVRDLKINNPIVKDYFLKQGLSKHISLDINGQSGAMTFDLAQECQDKSLIGVADYVTNFGTSEHVDNQHGVFLNIHKFCKIGGLIIHEVPKKGHWKGHSPFFYTEDFFQAMAKDLGYELLRMESIKYRKGDLLAVCLKHLGGEYNLTPEWMQEHVSLADSKVSIREFWKPILEKYRKP